jgi:hypothetical protein
MTGFLPVIFILREYYWFEFKAGKNSERKHF